MPAQALIVSSPYRTAMEYAGALIDRERVNTLLAWVLTGFLVFAAAESAIDGELLWAGLAAVAAAVALIPAANRARAKRQ